MVRRLLKKRELRKVFLQALKEDKDAGALPFYDNATIRDLQNHLLLINPSIKWQGQNSEDKITKYTFTTLYNGSARDTRDTAREEIREGRPLYLVLRLKTKRLYWRQGRDSLFRYQILIPSAVTLANNIWRPGRND